MKRSKLLPFSTLISLIGSASIAFSGTHTVQPGDTLWRISVMHKVTVADIQQANNLSGNTIELGQVLTIPSKITPAKAIIVPAKAVIVEQPKSANKTHIVRKGENLWRIARNNNTTMEALMKRNNLTSDVIEVGQVILLSGPSKSVAKPSRPVPEKVEKIEEKLPEKTQPEKPELKELPKEPQEVTPAEAVKPVDKVEVDKELAKIDPLSPLPPVVPSQTVIPKAEVVTEAPDETIAAKETEPSKPKGLEALTEKQRGIVRQQILLDRNGMGPGVIDGYEGNFSKTAMILAEHHRSEVMQEETPLIIETTIPAAVLHYINPTLPGSGKRPDFKQATEDQCLMMYKTAVELLAERYHCSEKLLAKMNPQIDFKKVNVGQKIMVPNVTEFKIEEFMDSAGKAVTYKYLRSSRRASRVDVDYLKKRIMVWYNNGAEGAIDELLASFPVTTNIKKGPKSQRTIAYFAPAPNYMRKKTGLKLKPGPNSPVGIVWAKLGDGFGIHGTSDGSGNGYNTSSGCIRLSNWDMAVFVKIVPSKTKVNFITEARIAEKAQPAPASISTPESVSMNKR